MTPTRAQERLALQLAIIRAHECELRGTELALKANYRRQFPEDFAGGRLQVLYSTHREPTKSLPAAAGISPCLKN